MDNLDDQIRHIIVEEGGDGSDFAVAQIKRLFDKSSEKDIRKHEMTGYLVDMLKVAVQHVHDTDHNDFKKGDIAEGLYQLGASAYGNFPQLRYFGLIAHPEVEGVKQKRRWLVTKTGGAFLRGEYDVRAWVKIKDNHIVERSERRVDIRRLGHSPMQTTFEYYDKDSGKKVAVRPAPESPKAIPWM